jgi:hypothetical protein
MTPKRRSTSHRLAILLAVSVGLTACATRQEAEGPLRKEHVFAVTADGTLIRFNAGQPSRVLESKPVTGLVAQGEQLVGLDFRVARGVLYALSGVGRIYTLDTATGVLKQVGTGTLATALQGDSIGMDFNPAVDRIRIVTASGQNLRAHPDTGVQVDSNATLQGVQSDSTPQFDRGDVNMGQKPVLAAAAYTYNNENEKITTMYAIDRATGSLVRQGSKEGVQPFVSPDTGKLTTIGALGTGPLVDAAFDISDVANTPLIAVRTAADARTRLHLLDLSTGKATSLGIVGDGRPVIGIAIEP